MVFRTQKATLCIIIATFAHGFALTRRTKHFILFSTIVHIKQQINSNE